MTEPGFRKWYPSGCRCLSVSLGLLYISQLYFVFFLLFLAECSWWRDALDVRPPYPLRSSSWEPGTSSFTFTVSHAPCAIPLSPKVTTSVFGMGLFSVGPITISASLRKRRPKPSSLTTRLLFHHPNSLTRIPRPYLCHLRVHRPPRMFFLPKYLFSTGLRRRLRGKKADPGRGNLRI